MSFNILRFPSFQAIPILPKEIREQKAKEMDEWLVKNEAALHAFEIEGLRRTIEYTRVIEEGHSYTSSLVSRERDFRNFFHQYDLRRKKNFTETFPELKEWYESLPAPITIPIRVAVTSGDSSGMTMPFAKELKKRAEEEGWVEIPNAANPGSQDYGTN